MIKLIKINPKNLRLSPKRLFRSSKNRSSRSDPSSYSYGSASSSSSSSSQNKSAAADLGTPTSVLPGEWSDVSPDASGEANLELLQAFKLIDRDNDGVVSREELEALLSRMGAEPPTPEELAVMLREVGCDGHGGVSLEALTRRVGSACGAPCDAELRETFDFFDTDRDGRITAEELRAVFRAMGDERCTLEDCRRMISAVDKNGRGFVCFDDFSIMMEHHRVF